MGFTTLVKIHRQSRSAALLAASAFWTDGRTDGRTDGGTDGGMDERSWKWLLCWLPLCTDAGTNEGTDGGGS
jgi:hypothetical protein